MNWNKPMKRIKAKIKVGSKMNILSSMDRLLTLMKWSENTGLNQKNTGKSHSSISRKRIKSSVPYNPKTRKPEGQWNSQEIGCSNFRLKIKCSVRTSKTFQVKQTNSSQNYRNQSMNQPRRCTITMISTQTQSTAMEDSTWMYSINWKN